MEPIIAEFCLVGLALIINASHVLWEPTLPMDANHSLLYPRLEEVSRLFQRNGPLVVAQRFVPPRVDGWMETVIGRLLLVQGASYIP